MAAEIKDVPEILRRKQVEARTGLSRSSIYRAVAAGRFPRPVSLLGGKSVGWLASEIRGWLESRIAARNEKRG